MKKWEYNVVETDINIDILKNKLNALAEDDWELVTINGYRAGHWALTLKKQIKE